MCIRIVIQIAPVCSRITHITRLNTNVSIITAHCNGPSPPVHKCATPNVRLVIAIATSVVRQAVQAAQFDIAFVSRDRKSVV